MKKRILWTGALIFGGLTLSGCGGGAYQPVYYTPAPQQKSMDQVAKDSVHLSAQDKADINKLTEKK